MTVADASYRTMGTRPIAPAMSPADSSLSTSNRTAVTLQLDNAIK
jgi:hypothetical protein